MKLEGLRNKGKTVRRKLAGKLVKGHLELLKRIDEKSPLSLSYWLFCRKVIGIILPEPDPLFPPYESLYSTGEALEVPELKRFLANDILGTWALDAQTIRLIWALLWQDQPQVILECGSGVSTLVLAVYASLSSSQIGKDCLIISLEQDRWFKAEVEERLKESNLDGFAKVFHGPLDDQGFYDLHDLEPLLADKCVQWVLIDGPSGPLGCRYGTLPTLLRFCRSRARWFLDDSFRDGELQILRRWRNGSGITVEGIYPVGKGLATGRVP